MVLLIYNWPETNLQCGYGTQLFKHAKTLVKEMNMPRIELDVWSFNKEAEAFYASQGVVTTEEKMSLEL